jgi:hypothetical protein
MVYFGSKVVSEALQNFRPPRIHLICETQVQYRFPGRALLLRKGWRSGLQPWGIPVVLLPPQAEAREAGSLPRPACYKDLSMSRLQETQHHREPNSASRKPGGAKEIKELIQLSLIDLMPYIRHRFPGRSLSPAGMGRLMKALGSGRSLFGAITSHQSRFVRRDSLSLLVPHLEPPSIGPESHSISLTLLLSVHTCPSSDFIRREQHAICPHPLWLKHDFVAYRDKMPAIDPGPLNRIICVCCFRSF